MSDPYGYRPGFGLGSNFGLNPNALPPLGMGLNINYQSVYSQPAYGLNPGAQLGAGMSPYNTDMLGNFAPGASGYAPLANINQQEDLATMMEGGEDQLDAAIKGEADTRPGVTIPAEMTPELPTGSGAGLGAPQGEIPRDLSIAFGRGATWDAVNAYDAVFVAEAAKYGIDPAMLKAMAVIESGGNPNVADPHGATGIMQVKPGIWGTEAARLGYDLSTPEGQIGMAAAILGGGVAASKGMDPITAFRNVYYPIPGGGVGESGHTQAQYLADMTRLMTIIKQSPAGAAAAGRPGVDPASPENTAITPLNTAVIPVTGTNTGNKLVEAAKGFLGTDYVWGAPYGAGGPASLRFDANGRPTAFDCSGFVAYLAKTYLGQDISTGSHQQWGSGPEGAGGVGRKLLPGEPMLPGDILFFSADPNEWDNGNNATHVGIYLGTNKEGQVLMINALNEDAGVVISDISVGGVLLGVRRL